MKDDQTPVVPIASRQELEVEAMLSDVPDGIEVRLPSMDESVPRTNRLAGAGLDAIFVEPCPPKSHAVVHRKFASVCKRRGIDEHCG